MKMVPETAANSWQRSLPMIRQLPRGILALVLVSCIAMMMLLGFGVRATLAVQKCQVSPIDCRYAKLIIAANSSIEP